VRSVESRAPPAISGIGGRESRSKHMRRDPLLRVAAKATALGRWT
jgi:hypothetical protein